MRGFNFTKRPIADVGITVLLVNSIRATKKAFATLDKQSEVQQGKRNLKKSI